jgi:glycosyltransferase involved in cell wall biosynthesis
MLHVLLVLLAYRLSKNNLVWTVHELDAYESRRPRLDRWFRQVLMKLCRHLIVHGEYTRQELLTKHGFRRPITVVRHPSYRGFYADTVNRADARERLSVAESARVLLYFGYIKPYKGVEELLSAFQSAGDENAVLIVAGKPLDEATQRQIESLATPDPRVRLQLGYIPDDQIQILFRAADIAVFPFQYTQTSGSLMLALGFGRPVVAPGIATVPEYVGEDCGFLFDPEKPGDLARALGGATSAPLTGMDDAAASRGCQDTWRDMALTHQACYQEVAP